MSHKKTIDLKHGIRKHVYRLPEDVKHTKIDDLITIKKTRQHVYAEITIDSAMTTEQMHRLNKFMIWCVNNNVNMSLFGNNNPIKEMSEVVGTWKVIEKLVPKTGLKTICYCIGDGKNPRTGYIIAKTRSWDVVVVDPILNTDKFNDLDNLKLMRCRDSDLDISWHLLYDRVVIVGCHSHNDMETFYKQFLIPTTCVWIPCCVMPESEPHLIIESRHIISTKNKAYVWYNNQISL